MAAPDFVISTKPSAGSIAGMAAGVLGSVTEYWDVGSVITTTASTTQTFAVTNPNLTKGAVAFRVLANSSTTLTVKITVDDGVITYTYCIFQRAAAASTELFEEVQFFSVPINIANINITVIMTGTETCTYNAEFCLGT